MASALAEKRARASSNSINCHAPLKKLLMVTEYSGHDFWCERLCCQNQSQHPAVGQNVIFRFAVLKPLVSPHSDSFWPSTEFDADCLYARYFASISFNSLLPRLLYHWRVSSIPGVSLK